ncbi:MAG: hypothetical protein IAF94_21580 [Pirellulaceae bacterium]|nr:hypothetical protein [Pirellulaceae bacterium]
MTFPPFRHFALCTLHFALGSLLLAGTVLAQSPPRLEFTRLVAHWSEYNDPQYVPFLFEAEPEVVQLGFYGAHFWSLAHTSSYNGYPSHLPVQGHKECGAWFEEKNALLHTKGMKVVGHFNVEFLVGDPDSPEGPRGFFKFYRDLWDEKELGPKPVADPLTMLEKNADGTPISQAGYGIGGMKEYWACLRNPDWQKVMKAWVKRGVDRGIDGYIANYFYRHNCLCEHCQRDFRSYLKERFKPEELKTPFAIDNLEQHKFTEIVSWHDPKESTPLRREMLRFSQISNKQVFDEVFIKYGRSLKKDLIAAQWNHIGNLHQISGDERCLLPAELWGKDEDYLWYSTGGAACYTDLAKGDLGEGTLQARYIRGMFQDKPFTLGKYESTRIRVAIAELAANGGAPMGFYTRFKDPLARQEITRYYQFLKRFDEIYRGNVAHSERTLVYPRTAVFRGDLGPVEAFRAEGKKLLDEHVLFEVVSDEVAKSAKPQAGTLSKFDAPPTVRVSANRSAKGNELDFHFVNYNREEPPKDAAGNPSPGSGIIEEKPIAVKRLAADVQLPAGAEVVAVEFISPEQPDAKSLAFQVESGRVKFEVPEFLVYGVARVKIKP